MKRILKFLYIACLMTAIALPVRATDLPAGYTELEYIQSNGTQYIDTGIAKTSLIFDIKTRVSYANTTGRYLFGTSGSSPNYCGRHSSGKFELNNNYSTLVSRSNVVYDLHYYGTGHGTYFTISTSDANTETLSAGAGATGDRNYTILGNGAYNLMKGNIYYYELSVGNVLKFKGIPAKRNSDETVGMYDLVSGQFFTNAGTGTFTAGPDVPKIKIATTKYTEEAFAGLVATLNSAIDKVTNIVDDTVQQATEIGVLAETKQDRPDTDCPAGRKCLLIMGADNKPHWYLIQE